MILCMFCLVRMHVSDSAVVLSTWGLVDGVCLHTVCNTIGPHAQANIASNSNAMPAHNFMEC